MSAAAWAGAGYAAWLVAGGLDFLQHARTDLAHTSGVRESTWHAVQLGLVGSGVLAWLALAPGLGLLMLLGTLAAAHAVAGYLDTRTAYGCRPITPVEQHVHSVLDMAPWIAVGAVVMGQGNQARTAGWPLAWQPAAPALWLALLLPALLLAGLPWGLEFRAALRARGS